MVYAKYEITGQFRADILIACRSILSLSVQ